MMTKRERVQAVYGLQKADRVPFVPAIYEHKAKLIGRSPSQVCRNPDFLYAALVRELELYDPDAIVIGVDVYNVEAEAMGCPVTYFDGSNDVPAISAPIIQTAEDLRRLRLPDPERDGRMPMYLRVARAMASEYGARMIVRGAVSGPFSMAAAVAGGERLALATAEEPGFAQQLLRKCAELTIAFGTAFLASGVEPMIFDSCATPRLASPRVFNDVILPIYRDHVFPQLRAAGGQFMPLIIGGDTTSIIPALIRSGASQLLCDSPASRQQFREACAAARVPFRANVDARLVSSGPPHAIREHAKRILQEAGGFPGLLLGCGVVAYDTDPENALAIREAIDSISKTD